MIDTVLLTYITPSHFINNIVDLSLAIELRRSPRIAKISPVKVTKEEQSPSKKGSTVKALDFSDGANDMFDDEWDIGDVDDVGIL